MERLIYKKGEILRIKVGLYLYIEFREKFENNRNLQQSSVPVHYKM